MAMVMSSCLHSFPVPCVYFIFSVVFSSFFAAFVYEGTVSLSPSAGHVTLVQLDAQSRVTWSPVTWCRRGVIQTGIGGNVCVWASVCDFILFLSLLSSLIVGTRPCGWFVIKAIPFPFLFVACEMWCTCFFQRSAHYFLSFLPVRWCKICLLMIFPCFFFFSTPKWSVYREVIPQDQVWNERAIKMKKKASSIAAAYASIADCDITPANDPLIVPLLNKFYLQRFKALSVTRHFLGCGQLGGVLFWGTAAWRWTRRKGRKWRNSTMEQLLLQVTPTYGRHP